MKLKRAPWSDGGSYIDPEPALFFGEINTEVIRSRERYPGSRHMLAALVEEVGELAEAIANRDADAVKKEAVQVAATAIRIAEEGDETVYQFDGFVALVAAMGNVARGLLQWKQLKEEIIP